MQKFARFSILLKIPVFPFLPSSAPGARASATKQTRASDLWVFSPSHINVHTARCYIKEPDEAGRAMADILKLHFGALSG